MTVEKIIRNGFNLRKIVSEVVNGETITKILNPFGKEIYSRAKTFEVFKVGDKTVRRIIKKSHNTYTLGEYDRNVCSEAHIEITDRVYDSQNKFIGQRIEIQSGSFGSSNSKKLLESLEKYGDPSRVIIRSDNRINWSTETLFYDNRRSSKKYSFTGDEVSYNDKGLPIPKILSFDSRSTVAGKSLPQMVDMAKQRYNSLSTQSIILGRNR